MKKILILLCAFCFWNSNAIAQSFSYLDSVVKKSSMITNHQISTNGKWVLFHEMYGLSTNDIEFCIMNTASRKQMVRKKNASKVGFAFDDEAYWLVGNQAKRMSMSTCKTVDFNGVKTIGYDDVQKILVVHYNEKAAGRLEFYDKSGKMLHADNNVAYWKSLSENITFIKKSGDKYQAFQWKNGNVSLIFESTEEIYDLLDSKSDIKGQVLYLRNDKKAKKNIFVGQKISDHSVLNNLFDLGDNYELSIFDSPVPNALLLEITRIGAKKPQQLVDIWYSVDKNLKEKYIPYERQKSMVLWYPLVNKIVTLGDNKFTNTLSVNNPSTFINFNESELEDYTTLFTPLNLYTYNTVKAKSELLTERIEDLLRLDPFGKWLLWKKGQGWTIYNIESKMRKQWDNFKEAEPYFLSENVLIWINGNEIWEHHLATGKLERRMVANGHKISISNSKRIFIPGSTQYDAISRKVINGTSLFLEVKDSTLYTTSYISLQGKRITTIIPATTRAISRFYSSADGKYCTWLEEDYNCPVIIKVWNSDTKKAAEIYQTGKDDLQVKNIQKRRLYYKGAHGEMLSGALLIPADFNEKKKYPVVVNIYEKVSYRSNEFLRPSIQEADGFNARILLEMGYMVFLPDISYGEKGAGLSALECINNALDVLLTVDQVDSERIGLCGHSHGGYQTSFIATRSDRFKTFIAGAPITDIMSHYLTINLGFKWLEYRRVERAQLDMRQSFSENKQKYWDNNPINNAMDVKAPVLLWHGNKDTNVLPRQSMSFYSALRRDHVPVIALFYPEEKHSMTTRDAQYDLNRRMIEWWGYFLKDRKDVDWINKEMKPTE